MGTHLILMGKAMAAGSIGILVAWFLGKVLWVVFDAWRAREYFIAMIAALFLLGILGPGIAGLGEWLVRQ